MAGPHDKSHRHDADKKHAPTAGPDYDDRGPDPQRDQEAALHAAHISLAHDRQVRIIGMEVKGRGTLCLLGSGFKQGVTEGMSGYIAGEHGPYADFTIEHVDDVTCKAYIEAIPDEIRAHMQHVIINPAQSPQAVMPPDTKTRILSISVEGNKTRIMVGKGRMQGAKWGDPGVVIGSNGVRLASFTLDDVQPRTCGGLVDLVPDQLKGADIILKPSKH
jgi:hypothetical protein